MNNHILLNSKQSNKLAGGITVILILALVLYISMKVSGKYEKFDNITETVSTFFEPNKNLITVESFGDHNLNFSPANQTNNNSMGYWDNSANQHNPTYSHGPPVGGTQSASYQMYQQAVNASTPSMEQLNNISNQPGGGQGYINTPERPGIVPPAGGLFDAAAVDFGNRRAELISPCAQNAPTFVASSLLPKTNLPGVPSWNVTDTQALANQDFLSPGQQIGTDTVSSSLRNASYDIRGTIPNPITVVSPWLNSTIDPDLTRRPLECHQPTDGFYGCGK